MINESAVAEKVDCAATSKVMKSMASPKVSSFNQPLSPTTELAIKPSLGKEIIEAEADALHNNTRAASIGVNIRFIVFPNLKKAPAKYFAVPFIIVLD